MTEHRAEAVPVILFPGQRQHEIVALTLEDGRVDVAGLAERFGVTTETIRRDLSDLQSQRLVRRVHGGAVPWETAGFEPLLSVRNDQSDDEKRRMAAIAVDELPDTGAVIIDSGSTLTRFAESIKGGRDIRVVTNSLLIAQVLAECDPIEVVVIGGKLRTNTLAMVDSEAVTTVQSMSVDTLFISSDGASPDTGLTTPYREEAALKKAMIRAARRVVALVDHTKFGPDHLAKFAAWSDVDVLITNTELDPEIVDQIQALGTSVRQA